MKKYIVFIGTILLVLVPLILGRILDRIFLSGISSFWWLPIALIFAVFWAWAGSRFAALSLKKIYAFLLGNSLTILLYLLYMLGPKGTGLNVYLWSQRYFLPVAGLFAKVTERLQLGSSFLAGGIFLGYLFMVLVFSVGFYINVRREQRA